jgi:uncharacterized protein YjbI with pentapeptide repeats
MASWSRMTRPPLSTFASHAGPIAPALAVQYPALSRHVRFAPGERVDLVALVGAPVHTLDLQEMQLAALPADIERLVSLRVIKLGASKLASVPASLWSLPRLSHVFLDNTQIADLDLSHRPPWLKLVSLFQTPLGNDPAKLAAAASKYGAQVGWPASLKLGGDVPAAPADKAALVRAIAEDMLHPWTRLDGRDLSGAMFRGIRFSNDAPKANLAGTSWFGCEIAADLEGAQLAGAVFEECVLVSSLEKVKAKGARFVRCYFATTFTGADLENARFESTEPDSSLTFEKAKTKGMVTDAGSTPAPPPATDTTLVDPQGPRAEPVGRIDANSAMLWLLAVDAKAAAAWRGGTGEDGDDDFTRAEAASDKGKPVIAVGKAKGLIVEVGDCGWSHLYALPSGGFALLEYRTASAAPSLSAKRLGEELGLRVAQLPAAGKPKRLGSVEVTSKCLALLLPHEPGKLTAAQLATKKPKNAGAARLLVPVANGTYDVFVDIFPQSAYDAIGTYRSRVRIVKARKKK